MGPERAGEMERYIASVVMRMNDLEQAEYFFEEKGFRVHQRNYFSDNDGLFVTTEVKIEGGLKYFEYGLFFYLDEDKLWTVRVAPHGREHKISQFESLTDALELAEDILCGRSK